MEIYLKTGDIAVEFSACLFEKELEKDFEAYVEITADSEGGLNWIAVHNMIDQATVISGIVIPAVISVANTSV